MTDIFLGFILRKIGVHKKYLGVIFMAQVELSTDLPKIVPKDIYAVLSEIAPDDFFVANNPNEICKSNNLIESSYRLTMAQNRLIYMGMSKLKKIILYKNMNIEQVEKAIKTAQFEEIYIDVIDYKKRFGLKANNLYEQLAKIATELQKQTIIYYDEKDILTSITWVITCKYDNDNKGIAMQFHPNLIKDLLIFRNQYTRMIFDNFADLNGKYSWRIYELCKQYLKYKRRDFYVENLRFMLGILDSEYKTYSDFKRQVLKTSIAEISALTDLLIDLEEIEKDKKTRKVKKIRIHIKLKENYHYPTYKSPNKQVSLFKEDDDEDVIASDEDRSVVQKLSDITGLNLTAGQAEAILTSALSAIDKYKLDIGVLAYIEEKMVVCNDYSLHHVITAPVGLIIKSLQCNWKKGFIITEEYEQGEEFRINGLTGKELEEKLNAV